ncbi:hypothetical protein [Hymenobacter sp. IS2118]|uniref:hypothetical protein n=1 Tax=Hymenobacter sp. IS2118 TaxID=1505605 RepID=UPI000552851C|nr:hypothetical protein [Hymenobacter sp. IS2118]
MKKYGLLAALVLGLPACGLLGNECGRDNPPTYFDVQGLDVAVTRQPVDKPWEVVSPGASVASRELRLFLLLRERHYTVAPSRGFMSAAYACDPLPAGSRGSTERMDSLSVTSLNDYDAQHPAGTPLTDLLAVGGLNSFPVPSRQNPLEPFRYAELSLVQPPAATGPQQFRVYYRQTNGEIYTAETAAVTVVR